MFGEQNNIIRLNSYNNVQYKGKNKPQTTLFDGFFAHTPLKYVKYTTYNSIGVFLKYVVIEKKNNK